MKGIFVLLLISNFLLASEYQQGRTLYFQKGCANCHGTQAEGSGTFPKLANKRKYLIEEKLKEFKEGKASSQTAEMMFSFAQSLSMKEINELAIFLSTFKKDTSDKYKISDDILGSVD